MAFPGGGGMGGGFDKIGLEAIFVTGAFTAGLKTYLKGLADARQATASAASGLAQEAAQIGGGGAFGAILTGATTALGLFGTAAVTAFTTVASAVGIFITATAGLALAAARVSGVEYAFQKMGGSVGLSLDKLRTAAAGTIADVDLMKRSNLALLGSGDELARMFGENLPTILELTRATARATGMDFDYVFNSIVVGIKRSSPRLIDNIGLVIKAGEENARMAASVGKTTEELTAQEKQIATFNAVMRAAPQYIELFTGAQESAGERLARLKTTTVNIAQTLGQYFVPALNVVTGALDRLTQGFFKAIQEGGSLYPLLVSLGAVAKLAAEGFTSFVDWIFKAAAAMTDGLAQKVADAIDNAFDWGLDLVFQFAKGVFEGATRFLETAISIISGLLSFWFGPGSPPRLAADIDEWGAATMAEYLHGFAQADFSILQELKSPLSSILDIMADVGQIAKQEAKTLFAEITMQMVKGLGAGDLSGAFEKIMTIPGSYARELIQLVKLNQQLAQAQKDVAAAEKAVADARDKESKLTDDLVMQIAEYNDLARAGADPAALKAKMDQINATEESLVAAKAEVKAAEQQEDAAKANLDVVKEQVELQKELVQVLLDVAKAQADAFEEMQKALEAKAPKGGLGGLGVDEEDMESGLANFSALAETFQQRITEAINAMKDRIRQGLLDLWADIRTQAEEQLGPALETLRAKWEEFKALLVPVWEGIKQGWRDALDVIEGWWQEHGESVKIVFASIGGFLASAVTWIGGILSDFGKFLSPIWENIWTAIQNIFKNDIKAIMSIFKSALDFIGNIFDFFAAVFQGDWREAWEELVQIGENVINMLKTAWETGIENVKEIIIAGLQNTVKIVEWASALGKDLIEGIKKGISNTVESLYKLAKSIAKGVVDAISGVFKSESPSKVMFEIGESLPKGLQLGIKKDEQLPVFQAGRMATATKTAVMAAQPVTTNTSYANNFYMGGVSVYSPMDMARLEAVIDNVMRRRGRVGL
jgi:phage-related protein